MTVVMRMTVAFLQFAWQHLLPGGAVPAADGRLWAISGAGTTMGVAGPIFFNARVRMYAMRGAALRCPFGFKYLQK